MIYKTSTFIKSNLCFVCNRHRASSFSDSIQDWVGTSSLIFYTYFYLYWKWFPLARIGFNMLSVQLIRCERVWGEKRKKLEISMAEIQTWTAIIQLDSESHRNSQRKGVRTKDDKVLLELRRSPIKIKVVE
jgi:hypothetical protein